MDYARLPRKALLIDLRPDMQNAVLWALALRSSTVPLALGYCSTPHPGPDPRYSREAR